MILQQRENQVRVTAPAKVNLFLELLAKRADGFHELETVMAGISLYDTLTLSPRSDNDVRLCIRWSDPKIADPTVPVDDRNLVIKAIKLLQTQAESNGRLESRFGVDVTLTKRIPTQAGLGGASSDAAAALIGVSRLWQTDMKIAQLSRIASQIGSDVPFFLEPGSAICRGRGELIENISDASRMHIVVGKPPVGMSTNEIYNRCKIPPEPKASQSILDAMSKGSVREIGKSVFNRLQVFAGDSSHWVRKLRSEFSATHPLGHQLTGSGSCYFGLYSNCKVAIKAARCLSNRNPEVRFFVGHTLAHYSAPNATKHLVRVEPKE